MSLIAIQRPDNAQALVKDLTATLQARLAAGTQVSCPVEFAAAFTGACAAQSCGKCVPCRIGLAQMKAIMDNILDGVATEDDLNTLERLARTAYASADCAIGYEAGAAVLRAVKGFRDDFLYHINHDNCSLKSAEAAVPCRAGCPAHVDIPGYIALVAAGRPEDAVKLIRKDNPLPLVCGLICEHPCELTCRRGMVDDALNIRALKRYAVDNAPELGTDYTPFHYPETGKTVAVLGGGPAGLAAAYYLALMGHKPTIFEARAALGGMLRYGIPAYRLPRPMLQKEIDFLLAQGIETRLNTWANVEELRANYDAVYIAIGAHADKKLGIPGEGAEGVLSAVQILRAAGDGQAPDFTGKKVAVVGGGNVAMDCARTAVRLGAQEVSIVYRRRMEDMTAQQEEIDGAMAEGCRLLELQAPVAVETADDKVMGLRLQPQVIGPYKNGRPAPYAADAPETVLPVDIILVAIGQDIQSGSFAEAGMPVNRGRFVADKFAAVRDMPGVFVGGDCESAPATVIRAVAAGKAAARNIDAYLGFNHIIKSDVDIPAAAAGDRPNCGRCKTAERPADERRNDFDLMELGYTAQEAVQEANRCLRCDHFGLGAFREGRYPEW